MRPLSQREHSSLGAHGCTLLLSASREAYRREQTSQWYLSLAASETASEGLLPARDGAACVVSALAAAASSSSMTEASRSTAVGRCR